MMYALICRPPGIGHAECNLAQALLSIAPRHHIVIRFVTDTVRASSMFPTTRTLSSHRIAGH